MRNSATTRLVWSVGLTVLLSLMSKDSDAQSGWSPSRPGTANQYVARSESRQVAPPTELQLNEAEALRPMNATTWGNEPSTYEAKVAQLQQLDARIRQLKGQLSDQVTLESLPPPRPSPSDSRKVIPFGVRNNSVDIKRSGDNISLVARDAPLREILALLAKSQKLNLIFASTPTGAALAGANAQAKKPPNQRGRAGMIGGNIDANMTVTLEDVPLDTALDTILSVAGFTWTRNEGIILVTPSDGSAQLPPNAQGRTMQVFELDFAVASDLDGAIQGLLSPIGQSFTTNSINNDNRRSMEAIVVEDTPRYVDRIAKYIAQIDIPPRQVAIQAYILEVELGSTMRHGLNLEYLANQVDPRIRLGSVGLARSTPAQAFFLELDGPRLDGLLDVLRTTVDAKTLASPRIIAVNGQESRLQVGEQLGFRVTTTTQTSTLESVEFLDVGVVLSVTPRISRDGRVLLHVRPEVSSGQVNPETGLPEEETAELQTDVLLDDGQGIVVGGLIKEDINNGQNKVPGVGDVPYLGALFEARNDRRSRTEIIVALVPKILPLDPERKTLDDLEYRRATTPLMHGALVENPRPSEPSLPDPLRRLQRNYLHGLDRKDQWQAERYASDHPQHSDLRTSAIRHAGYNDAISPRPVHQRSSPSRVHPMDVFRGMRFWRRK